MAKTDPEPSTTAGALPYDGLAQLAARLTGAPVAALLLERDQVVEIAGRSGIGSHTHLTSSDPLREQVIGAERVVHRTDLAAGDDTWWRGPGLVAELAVRAFLGVPVRDHDGRAIGALLVMDRHSHEWATEDATALLAVADRVRMAGAAPAPSDAAAEEAVLHRAGRFRACHLAVERSLRSSRTAADAAPQLLEAVAVALGWPAAELFLVHEGTGTLDAVGHWSNWATEPEGLFGHTPIKGAGLPGRVWQTGRPIWVDDITLYTDLVTPYEQGRADRAAERGIRTVMAVPVCDGDTILGVLTCYADTTERHQDLLTVLLDGVAAQIGLWLALRRAERLSRELGRAQDDLIALVGHELRTPLASITAHAGMLQEDAGALPPEHQDMVATIARNAASLQHTVCSLLDLAGLEAGHLPMHRERLDLCRIILDAVQAVRPRCAQLGLRLQTRLPPAVRLTGDPARLRQVIDDVLANAVLYSPSGGAIEVSATSDDTAVEVQVVDTGIGTPAEERARVFDRFYRGSNVRHQGTTGSGLGLSRARAILDLHHGHIQLTGNEPTGTTVTLRLPAGQDIEP